MKTIKKALGLFAAFLRVFRSQPPHVHVDPRDIEQVNLACDANRLTASQTEEVMRSFRRQSKLAGIGFAERRKCVHDAARYAADIRGAVRSKARALKPSWATTHDHR